MIAPKTNNIGLDCSPKNRYIPIILFQQLILSTVSVPASQLGIISFIQTLTLLLPVGIYSTKLTWYYAVCVFIDQRK